MSTSSLGSTTNAPSVLYVGDGAVGSPSLSFGSNTNTGIYKFGSNNIGFAANGTSIIRVNSSGIEMTTGALFAQNGTNTAPSHTFLSATNIGMYQGAGTTLGLAVPTGGDIEMRINSVQVVDVQAANIFLGPNVLGNTTGTAATPTYSFNGDSDTGIYRASSNDMRFSTNGVDTLRLVAGDVLINNGDFTISRSGVGGTVNSIQRNTDNTNVASHAQHTISVGGASAGDPFLEFLVTAQTAFSIGLDNSDADKFKISGSATLGSNDWFVMDATGKFGINTANTTANYQMRMDSTGKLGLSIYSTASASAAYLFLENDSGSTWSFANNGSLTANANKLDFAYNGTTKVRFDLNGPVYFSDGTAASPTISFINQANMGMYRGGTDTIIWAVNGIAQFELQPTQLFPVNDNVTNLGVSGQRWANIWGTTIHSGDIQMENDWRITEGDKVGYPEEGIMFLSPTGKKYKISMTEVA